MREVVESILRVGIERGEFKSIGLRELKTTARAIITVMRSLTIALFIDNDDQAADRLDHPAAVRSVCNFFFILNSTKIRL